MLQIGRSESGLPDLLVVRREACKALPLLLSPRRTPLWLYQGLLCSDCISRIGVFVAAHIGKGAVLFSYAITVIFVVLSSVP